MGEERGALGAQGSRQRGGEAAAEILQGWVRGHWRTQLSTPELGCWPQTVGSRSELWGAVRVNQHCDAPTNNRKSFYSWDSLKGLERAYTEWGHGKGPVDPPRLWLPADNPLGSRQTQHLDKAKQTPCGLRKASKPGGRCGNSHSGHPRASAPTSLTGAGHRHWMN